MSRSRKETPVFKGCSRHHNKWGKRKANRAVRRRKGNVSRKSRCRKLIEQ